MTTVLPSDPLTRNVGLNGRFAADPSEPPPGDPAGTPSPAGTDAAPGPVEVRRTSHGMRTDDVMPLVGAAAVGLSLTCAAYLFIAPLSGALGFVLLAWTLWMGAYAVLVAMDGDRQLVKDRLAAAVAHSLALLMLMALVVVVAFTLWQGRTVLTYLNFYTEDLSLAGPLAPLGEGGVLHAVAGTFVMMAISLTLTIPLAIVCALYLSESSSRLSKFVRTIVEAMTALPSVVAGLFVYAAIITSQSLLGVGQTSGLAASVALSVMMLPIMVRAADVVLRLVPGNLKEAAAALGAPRWRVVWHVVLPTSRSGLMTAIILGTARGIGETSPVLLTAGYTTGFNLDPLSGPMVSLPLLTFSLTKSPEPGYVARGFGAAAVLMALVLFLFVVARIVGGRTPGDLTRRQQRRRTRQSHRDVERMSTGGEHLGIFGDDEEPGSADAAPGPPDAPPPTSHPQPATSRTDSPESSR